MIPENFFSRSRMYSRFRKYASDNEYSLVEIYDYLNQPKSIAKMICTNNLGKSALEGVVREVESVFEEKFSFFKERGELDTAKQCVGCFVREILADYGYEKQSSCKMPADLKFFRNASHYIYTGKNKIKELIYDSQDCGEEEE